MIGYSLTRPLGGTPRYSVTQRQAARVAAANGDAFTLTEAAVDAMVSEDGIRVVADVLFEVESNRLRRATTNQLVVGGVNVAPFSGDVTTLTNGKRVATTAAPAVVIPAGATPQVKVTWTDPRPINVVELAEDTATTRVTQVRVSTWDGAAWTVRATVTSPGGRISALIAPYDDPISCLGVLVELLTVSLLGGATKAALVEVDPMLIWDISEDLVSCETSFAAEDDPSASTSPYGTYAATTCALVIDDSDGTWSDPGNTSLDAGHRIEVALGVVRIDNGYRLIGTFETGLDSFISSPNFGTQTPAALATSATRAHEGTKSALVTWPAYAGKPSNIGKNVPTIPGHSYLITAWVYVPAGSPDVRMSAALVSSGPLNGTKDAWVQIAHTFTATGISSYVSVRADAPAAGTTCYVDEFVYWVDPVDVEEVLPVGVFYAEPFDTDSDATSVTINGSDRLGRNSASTVSEQVQVAGTVDTLVRSLARTYLDLDGDQVVVDATIAGEVIPYAYPSGDLGSYLADVAKAYGAVLHMDQLERLVLAPRTAATDDPVLEISDDTSLVKFTRPPGQDKTTSQVVVNAAPLTLDVDSELWAMPPGGISIAVGADYTLVCTYTAPPGINGYVSGIVADGAYTVTSASYYADRAELVIHNPGPTVRIVADLRIRGNPLVESAMTARAVDAPSVDRYGARELTVDAKLVQTQTRIDALAAYLLDAFRSLDDNGIRRRPDLTFSALGLLHIAVGDRLTLRHATKGLGGDFVLLSRTLAYADGALLTNDARVREAPGYDVLTYDSGDLYDDGHVYGF